MYVWRFPIISFAWLVVTFGLAGVWMLIIELRSRASSAFLRGLLIAGGIVAAAVSPFIVQFWTEPELRSLAKHGVFKHYSPWAFLLPLMLAAILVIAAHVVFRRGTIESPAKWRAYFFAVCFVFVFMNLANWCSPGWCERFGFPLPYSWWSDAVIVMNGENLTAGASMIAGMLNLSILAAVVFVLTRSARRRSARPARPNSP